MRVEACSEQSAQDMFEIHVAQCVECKENSFGLCKRGFALLGRCAHMRDESNQPELFQLPAVAQEKPLARAAWLPQSEQRLRRALVH